ncbi:MAG: HRDC domain-containing protein, partial [Planctomycetes bacterium]|nr:HRDC domain-containing protein [Planctomycetota bacterium]
AMRAKVLTLRFSPQLGRFDDAPLLALQQKVVLEHVREHVVQIGGEPMLLCLAEWREQPQGAGAGLPRVEIAPRPVRAEAETVPFETPSPSADVSPPATSDPTTASNSGANGRAAHGPARPVGELRAELTEEQRALFDRVRSWRSRTAHQEGAPPYVILTNRQLVEIVRQRPDSKAGIGRIDGLGDKKVARYGGAILTLLWGQPADANSAAEEPRSAVEPAADPVPGEQEASA